MDVVRFDFLLMLIELIENYAIETDTIDSDSLIASDLVILT